MPEKPKTRRGKPTAGADRNARLRETVRAILVQEKEGNQREVAAALGMRPSSLSDFLSGRSVAAPGAVVTELPPGVHAFRFRGVVFARSGVIAPSSA